MRPAGEVDAAPVGEKVNKDICACFRAAAGISRAAALSLTARIAPPGETWYNIIYIFTDKKDCFNHMIDYRRALTPEIQAVPESSIKEFFDIINEMPEAISLGLGEPDFVTPEHIRKAGAASLLEGHTKYTQNPGLPALREAIAAYLAGRFALHYDAADEILVTVGGSEAIDLAIRCLVGAGDEVLVPSPTFVCYGPLAAVCGGVVKELVTTEETGFRVTAQQIAAALTERTKLLVLPYPSNPTGAILEESDLRAIANVLRGTNVIVLCDEIYGELTYGRRHCSFASQEDMRERTLVVGGFSKAFAMTGWRMGYLCGPRELVKPAAALHGYGIMSAPTVTQHAAIEAMRNGMEDIETMRTEYDARRALLVRGLREMGLRCSEPRGAFYCFPYIGDFGRSDVEFCRALLLEEQVAIIPGSAFGPGGAGYARVCYAAERAKIEEALRRMARFLKRLRTEKE